MDTTIITGIIAGVVSLIVSLIGFFVTRSKLKHDASVFSRGIDVELASKLYSLRLEHYGEGFDITDQLYYKKIDSWFLENEVRDVLKQLRMWKSGVVNLIISYEALAGYRDLVTALAVNPGNQGIYVDAQIEKIYEHRNKFRSLLRADLKRLHRGDMSEVRRSKPLSKETRYDD